MLTGRNSTVICAIQAIHIAVHDFFSRIFRELRTRDTLISYVVYITRPFFYLIVIVFVILLLNLNLKLLRLLQPIIKLNHLVRESMLQRTLINGW